LKTQDYQVIWLSENQDNRKRMSGCGRAARHVERLTLIETSCATYKRTTKLNNLLYNCRESSTNRPIFMQNKANLLDTQMQVSFVVTKDYENEIAFTFQKNKPNQSQFQALPLWIPENQTQSFDWIRQAHHKSAQDRTNPILRLDSAGSPQIRSEPALSLSKGQVSNLTLLKWVITRENALDIMASATKNAYLMGLNKNRKNRKIEANAAVYTFN